MNNKTLSVLVQELVWKTLISAREPENLFIHSLFILMTSIYIKSFIGQAFINSFFPSVLEKGQNICSAYYFIVSMLKPSILNKKNYINFRGIINNMFKKFHKFSRFQPVRLCKSTNYCPENLLFPIFCFIIFLTRENMKI